MEPILIVMQILTIMQAAVEEKSEGMLSEEEAKQLLANLEQADEQLINLEVWFDQLEKNLEVEEPMSLSLQDILAQRTESVQAVLRRARVMTRSEGNLFETNDSELDVAISSKKDIVSKEAETLQTRWKKLQIIREFYDWSRNSADLFSLEEAHSDKVLGMASLAIFSVSGSSFVLHCPKDQVKLFMYRLDVI